MTTSQIDPGPAGRIQPRTLSPLLTLRQPEFASACAELMRQVEADYLPTLVVGIRTGGFVVAEAMVRSARTALTVLPLTCQRAGTGAKARLPFLRSVLATLPRPAIDLLRRIEHDLLIAPRRHQSREQLIDTTEVNAIAGWLTDRPPTQRILVVDDAVDSGVTLYTVLQHLGRVCPPETEVRSAVITQTLPEPRIRPNYALYQQTLCRFPWSYDAFG